MGERLVRATITSISSLEIGVLVAVNDSYIAELLMVGLEDI